MFSTKHCFEKYNKNDRSGCSLKEMQRVNLTQFMPVLVLITHVIHLIQVIFCGSWKRKLLKQYLRKNLTVRKGYAYGTISYEICPKITPFKMTCTVVKSPYSRCFCVHKLHSRVWSFCPLSPTVVNLFFLPIKFFNFFLKSKRIICTLSLCNREIEVTMLV